MFLNLNESSNVSLSGLYIIYTYLLCIENCGT